MILKHKLKKKKAFSLAEIIMSMAIVSILMVMLLNILFSAVQLSIKTLARSAIREEISSISNQINRDVRNADAVINCGTSQITTECEFIENGERFKWSLCEENKICKTNLDNGNIIFESSDNYIFTKFEFGIGFDDSTSKSQQNILLTIVADHKNDSLNIKNSTRQQSLSTRNFSI